MTKVEIVTKLKESGVKFNPNDKKEVLEALLPVEPVNYPDPSWKPEEIVDEPVAQKSEGPIKPLPNPSSVTILVPDWVHKQTHKSSYVHDVRVRGEAADVFKRNGVHVRTYTKEVHGERFEMLARQYAEKRNKELTNILPSM